MNNANLYAKIHGNNKEQLSEEKLDEWVLPAAKLLGKGAMWAGKKLLGKKAAGTAATVAAKKAGTTAVAGTVAKKGILARVAGAAGALIRGVTGFAIKGAIGAALLGGLLKLFMNAKGSNSNDPDLNALKEKMRMSLQFDIRNALQKAQMIESDYSIECIRPLNILANTNIQEATKYQSAILFSRLYENIDEDTDSIRDDTFSERTSSQDEIQDIETQETEHSQEELILDPEDNHAADMAGASEEEKAAVSDDSESGGSFLGGVLITAGIMAAAVALFAKAGIKLKAMALKKLLGKLFGLFNDNTDENELKESMIEALDDTLKFDIQNIMQKADMIDSDFSLEVNKMLKHLV